VSTAGSSRAGSSSCGSARPRPSTRCTPRSRRRRVRYKNTTTDLPDTRRPRNSDYVQSLERGLSVIRAFDAEHRELGLSEVARATGLTRAAARRFLLTLVDLGYMHFDGSRFSLRPRVLELGFAYLSSLSLPQVAEPHMEALVAEINESSSVSVLDDLEVVYVARVPTRRIMSITLAVGTRLPAYATSMGRVLLAALPDAELEERLSRIAIEALTPRTVKDHDQLRAVLEQVRRQGYAVTDQELEQGLRSAAVPIHDASDAVVAALNVSVHASRASMAELRARFLPPARAAAAAIDHELRKTGLRATGAATVGLARGSGA
jgi:IclR family pca regulon transcriptional regulator